MATELAREGLAKGHSGNALRQYVIDQWHLLVGRMIDPYTLERALANADRRKARG